MDTLNIAICGNTQKDAALLRRMVADSGVSCRVFTYESGAAFLESFQPGFFQLVLLDIYYGGRRGNPLTGTAAGLTVAQKIRETDCKTWLAFTSVSREYAAEGYKVKAHRYLVKPLVAEEVYFLLQETAKHFEGANDEIAVLVERKQRRVRIHDIQYIEAQGRQSLVHTTDEIITTYTKIDDLEKLLSFAPFLRCHRGYIVNMKYVERTDRDFVLVNGDTVQIGRNQQWRSRREYRQYIVRAAWEGQL